MVRIFKYSYLPREGTLGTPRRAPFLPKSAGAACGASGKEHLWRFMGGRACLT